MPNPSDIGLPARDTAGCQPAPLFQINSRVVTNLNQNWTVGREARGENGIKTDTCARLSDNYLALMKLSIRPRGDNFGGDAIHPTDVGVECVRLPGGL
jgi:hypothetical protein